MDLCMGPWSCARRMLSLVTASTSRSFELSGNVIVEATQPYKIL